MGVVCIPVDVDGSVVVGRFTGQPTPEELEAFRYLIRTVRNKPRRHDRESLTQSDTGADDDPPDNHTSEG